MTMRTFHFPKYLVAKKKNWGKKGRNGSQRERLDKKGGIDGKNKGW